MASFIDLVFEADVFEPPVFTSVHTDVIREMNLLTKIIHLNSGVVEYHPVDDIYKEMRFIRANDESLRVMDYPVESRGNISKGGGKFTSRLAIYNHGWLIKPADETHVLKVTGEQISDIGTSGVALMKMDDFSPGVNVSVEYAPPDTEIVVLETVSGVTLSPEESNKVLALPTKEETAQEVWDHII